MERSKYLDFMEGYIARIRKLEKAKKEAGTEAELDTLNTYIELDLQSIRTAANAFERDINKE